MKRRSLLAASIGAAAIAGGAVAGVQFARGRSAGPIALGGPTAVSLSLPNGFRAAAVVDGALWVLTRPIDTAAPVTLTKVVGDRVTTQLKLETPGNTWVRGVVLPVADGLWVGWGGTLLRITGTAVTDTIKVPVTDGGDGFAGRLITATTKADGTLALGYGSESRVRTFDPSRGSWGGVDLPTGQLIMPTTQLGSHADTLVINTGTAGTFAASSSVAVYGRDTAVIGTDGDSVVLGRTALVKATSVAKGTPQTATGVTMAQPAVEQAGGSGTIVVSTNRVSASRLDLLVADSSTGATSTTPFPLLTATVGALVGGLGGGKDRAVTIDPNPQAFVTDGSTAWLLTMVGADAPETDTSYAPVYRMTVAR